MLLRPGLPELPPQMRALPVDDRGYPVPRFVEWIHGKPDFRIMNSAFYERATRDGLCWICGTRRPRKFAFVIGPMCAINRVSSEPPGCVECADFSARACPFLTMPKMRRREAGLPEETQTRAGVAIKRNPGVALVWITTGFRMLDAGNGFLFQVGDASIESGKPELERVARDQSPLAVAHLEKLTARAMRWVPA